MNSLAATYDDFNLFIQQWVKRMSPYMEEIGKIEKTEGFLKGDPATIERYYRIMFAAYCYDPKKVDLLNLCMSPTATLNGRKVYEIFEKTVLSKPFDLLHQLKNIDLPTLIIHGEEDIVPVSGMRKVHEAIKGSEFIVIPECGHFPYVERPDKLFLELQK